MTLRKRFLTVPTIAVAAIAMAGPARAASFGAPDAQSVLDGAGIDVCTSVLGRRVACLQGMGYTQGGSPVVSACVYSDLVFGQYGTRISCVTTHHWAYLGTPGACVSTMGSDPTACVGYDETDPETGDTTRHCFVWVRGSGWCRDA